TAEPARAEPHGARGDGRGRGQAQPADPGLRRPARLERAGQGAGLRRGFLEGHLPAPPRDVHRPRARRPCRGRPRPGGQLTPVKLAELTAAAPRLALVGLAKNTGKTVALNALLGELAAEREPVGVTSVGRDGERNDVIDFRIEKPLVRLGAGDLVATTDGLLAASGIPHELLQRTGVRTPMGEVLLARLDGAGTVEIAGPSAAADTRAVADSMLAAGARRVIIDGAIDRRAASSPDVSDGLVMSTGAILSEDRDEVVARTVEAVALVRLPPLDTEGQGALARRLAATLGPNVSAFAGEDGRAAPLPERFVLTAEAAE